MVTNARLKELLYYNPETGIFIWAVQRSQMRSGSVAGTLLKNGRRTIWVDGKQYYAHRLAWLYVHGSFPKNDIDHIDRQPDHNWISNLRDVTEEVNLQNQKLTDRKNSSGLLGAYWYQKRGLWVSAITISGRYTYLGYFKTKEAAHAAYLDAKRKHHIGFVEVA